MPDFFYKHKIVSLLVVIWALGLTSFVTVVVFVDPPDIPAGTVSALGVVFGLPALAVGLWQWRNGGKPK